MKFSVAAMAGVVALLHSADALLDDLPGLDTTTECLNCLGAMTMDATVSCDDVCTPDTDDVPDDIGTGEDCQWWVCAVAATTTEEMEEPDDPCDDSGDKASTERKSDGSKNPDCKGGSVKDDVGTSTEEPRMETTVLRSTPRGGRRTTWWNGRSTSSEDGRDDGRGRTTSWIERFFTSPSHAGRFTARDYPRTTTTEEEAHETSYYYGRH